jgi:hypothetical protein
MSSPQNKTDMRSVKLPKSFVAIDLSEKAPDAFERRGNAKAKENAEPEASERGRSEEREDSTLPTEDLTSATADAGSADKKDSN